MGDVVTRNNLRIVLALVLGVQSLEVVRRYFGLLMGLAVGALLTLLLLFFAHSKLLGRKENTAHFGATQNNRIQARNRIGAWPWCLLAIVAILNGAFIFFSRRHNVWIWESIWIGLWIPYSISALVTIAMALLLVFMQDGNSPDDMNGAINGITLDQISSEIINVMVDNLERHSASIIANMFNIETAIAALAERVGTFDSSANNVVQNPSLPARPNSDTSPNQPSNQSPNKPRSFYELVMSQYGHVLEEKFGARDDFIARTRTLKLLNYDSSQQKTTHKYTLDDMDSIASMRLANDGDEGYIFLDFMRIHNKEKQIFKQENLDVFFNDPSWSESYPRVIRPARIRLLQSGELEVLEKGTLS